VPSAGDTGQTDSNSEEADALSNSGRLSQLLNRANEELGDGVRVTAASTGNRFINNLNISKRYYTITNSD
jgi:hypothetical protein